AALLAVLLDRLDQVLGDPDVAQTQAAVLDRLRLAHAGAGDLLPGDLAAPREPGRVGQEVGGGEAPRRQLDHALRAEDLQPETGAGGVAGRVRGETRPPRLA